MARKHRQEIDPNLPLTEVLREDELKLIKFARGDDGFMENGFDLYGADWVNHTPDTINHLFLYLFGMRLWRYQLNGYYCPMSDIMIHGARGSGKTDSLAVMIALWTAMNPGHNWLHTAPSKDQAKKAFDAVRRWGKHAQDGRDFERLFIVHTREAPFPDMLLRCWDEVDIGTEFWFRSFGRQGEPMELLRSFEAGRISADEAFRTQQTDFAIRILAGCLRGPNHYMLAKNPELREEYQDISYQYTLADNWEERRRLEDQIENFTGDHGLSKRGKFYVYGNVGSATWEWERFIWGQKHPGKRFAVTWKSEDNPAFTKSQREALEQQFVNDPEGLKVEMLATRPVPGGDVFVAEQLAGLFDGEYDREAIERYEDREPGWKFIQSDKWGLVHYTKPPEVGALYAGGGDPGTGRVPHRNKWVNFVVRTDRYIPKKDRMPEYYQPGAASMQMPFEIVYWNTGNLTSKGQGSILPWLNDVTTIMDTYPMPHGAFAAEAGGTQKDVHEVAWGASDWGLSQEQMQGQERRRLTIWPLNMNAIKNTLIMQLQLILSHHLLVGPNIPLVEQELASYQIKDNKLNQDSVMALLAVTAVIWPIVAADLLPALEAKIQTEEEEPGWWRTEYVEQLDDGSYRDTASYRDAR